MEKTYKREVAVGLVALLHLIFGYAIWHEPSSALDVGRILAPLDFAFLGAAYGMDWLSKQGPGKQ